MQINVSLIPFYAESRRIKVSIFIHAVFLIFGLFLLVMYERNSLVHLVSLALLPSVLGCAVATHLVSPFRPLERGLDNSLAGLSLMFAIAIAISGLIMIWVSWLTVSPAILWVQNYVLSLALASLLLYYSPFDFVVAFPLVWLFLGSVSRNSLGEFASWAIQFDVLPTAWSLSVIVVSLVTVGILWSRQTRMTINQSNRRD